MVEEARTVACTLENGRHCPVSVGLVQLLSGSTQLDDGREDYVEEWMYLGPEVFRQSCDQMAGFTRELSSLGVCSCDN